MRIRALPITVAARGTGTEYLAVPSRGSPRWLLPVEPHLRRAALSLFRPQTLRGDLYKQLLVSGSMLKRIVAVPEAQALAATIGNALSRSVKLAFYVGTAGAFQKATALVTSEIGEVLGYAKLATLPAARNSLENERNALQLLNESTNIARHVPQVLFWRADQHLALLLTSPGPEQGGPRRLGRTHRDFLDTLGQTLGEHKPFGASEMWAKMLMLFREIQPMLSAEWRTRYGEALALLTAELAPRDVLVTLAHRDFTPWNTRLFEDGGLYAFDWEYSSRGYLADYDRHHFEFMTSLLLANPMWWRYSRAPQGSSPLSRLAYLVDVGLFYHFALFARQGAEDDKVLRRVASELDEALT